MLSLIFAIGTAGFVGTLSLILGLPHFWPGVLLTLATSLPGWYLVTGIRKRS